ncbi:MAG: hypothetical protein GOV15_03590 [Candidatus Diapherotrites archaeon]|nr:hypothetical protein [Candidatus Diapherotrites archaeon]
MSFERSVSLYFEHINAVGLFSILFVLSLAFVLIPGTFLSSGGGFLRIAEIGTSINLVTFLLPLVYTLLVLLATAFLQTILILRVKGSRSSMFIPDSELESVILEGASKMFLFFILMSAVSFSFNLLFSVLSVPLVFAQFVVFVVLLPFVFAVQSFVVDDYSFIDSLLESVRYVRLQPVNAAYFSIVSFGLLLFASLVSFAFDPFFFLGRFLSLGVTVFLVLPFLTIFQTNLYMKKFGLILD